MSKSKSKQAFLMSSISLFFLLMTFFFVYNSSLFASFNPVSNYENKVTRTMIEGCRDSKEGVLKVIHDNIDKIGFLEVTKGDDLYFYKIKIIESEGLNNE